MLSQFKHFRTKFNDLLHNESNRDTVPDSLSSIAPWHYMAICRYASGPVAKLHTSFAHPNLMCWGPTLVVSPEMTYETGQMSVRPSVGSIYSIVSTWSKPHRSETAGPTSVKLVYSMGCGTKLLGSGLLNFGPWVAQGHSKHSPVGRDTPPPARCSSSAWRCLKLVSESHFTHALIFNCLFDVCSVMSAGSIVR